MSGYKPEYFQLHELVPRDIFHDHPAHILWMIFDPFILMAADALRKRYGKMIINTWYWDGESQYRGWRPPDCIVGAQLSMHRFGKALDLIPVEITAEEIRTDMEYKPELEAFKYITRVEENVDWLHIDRANLPNTSGIHFFKP